LRHLRTVGVPGEVAGELIALLTQARTDPELAAVLDRTTDLVAAHGETLAAERLKAAAILSDVTQRLTEMSGYLTESGDAARSRFADTAAVNDDVIGQVRELTVEVNSATDLHVLQSTVCARLEAVSKQVMELRSREEIRLQEQTGRAERMRTRISDLERETQDLHSKLDQEKHGARLDPLTRLANRKSFDERFGQEVELCSQGRLSLTLLLWDIDNFKRINDTYGHRAGDRVLQSVGTCFLSGLRAEDFVARIGGEEFVVLLTGVPFARALTIADELRIGVSTLRFHFRGTPVKVTVSCGLTEVRPGDTGGVAFDRADKALYKAKNAGKNLCLPS
jgi:diguanylate cyclase